MYENDWILSSHQSNQKIIKNMKIAIIGAGGHAKEVYQSILHQEAVDTIDGFFVEPEFVTEGASLYGLPIKSLEELDTDRHMIHIAVGNIEFRSRMYQNLKEFGFHFANVIDSRSNISNSTLGEGVYVAPGSQITADAKIGNCVIVNTGSIISHDCEIHDFCNISPGSVLCGDVRVGEKSLIGAGSVIREKVWIRDNVILGMGSIVTKNILDPGTYVIQGNSTKKL
jgi:sugar O-acyltransferase (sialic acid O-acetyltransferase NeuD family)